MPAKLQDRIVEVKLVTNPDDIDYYSDIITRHHYLGSSAINRNTIVHVAKRGRDIVGILTWEPGVRKWFGLRDKIIGWTKQQSGQRLKYCVENRRFLMLIEEKNLASQVLKESLSRLNADGEKLFGHEFMLAETFVDPSRGNDGTCYKAAGWSDAGLTQGGHGSCDRTPKRYLIKELSLHGLSKLKSPEFTISDLKKAKRSTVILEQIDFRSLKTKLDKVPDFRKRHGGYPLTSLLALTLVAVMCGETTAKGIWRWIEGLSVEMLRNLGCRRTPSYPTIWRTLSNTNNEALSDAFCEWLSEQNKKTYIDSKIRILSLDGKKLKAASKASDTDIYILSLIDSISKTLIKQVPVGEKTNEIPIAQKMLEEQPLDASTIVTADALHTQTKLAKIIVKKTPTTSSRSKTTNQISERQSSKTPQKKIGRLSTILRSLHTEE